MYFLIMCNLFQNAGDLVGSAAVVTAQYGTVDIEGCTSAAAEGFAQIRYIFLGPS
jgi:hypothetical protein